MLRSAFGILGILLVLSTGAHATLRECVDILAGSERPIVVEKIKVDDASRVAIFRLRDYLRAPVDGEAFANARKAVETADQQFEEAKVAMDLAFGRLSWYHLVFSPRLRLGFRRYFGLYDGRGIVSQYIDAKSDWQAKLLQQRAARRYLQDLGTAYHRDLPALVRAIRGPLQSAVERVVEHSLLDRRVLGDQAAITRFELLDKVDAETSIFRVRADLNFRRADIARTPTLSMVIHFDASTGDIVRAGIIRKISKRGGNLISEHLRAGSVFADYDLEKPIEHLAVQKHLRALGLELSPRAVDLLQLNLLRNPLARAQMQQILTAARAAQPPPDPSLLKAYVEYWAALPAMNPEMMGNSSWLMFNLLLSPRVQQITAQEIRQAIILARRSLRISPEAVQANIDARLEGQSEVRNPFRLVSSTSPRDILLVDFNGLEGNQQQQISQLLVTHLEPTRLKQVEDEVGIVVFVPPTDSAFADFVKAAVLIAGVPNPLEVWDQLGRDGLVRTAVDTAAGTAVDTVQADIALLILRALADPETATERLWNALEDGLDALQRGWDDLFGD